MQGEQGRDERRSGRGVERQPGEPGEAQQQREGHLAAPDPRRAERAVRPRLQPGEPAAAEDEQDAARNAEELGKAEGTVGRLPPEAVMHDGSGGGRREAEQEAVHRSVMEPAAEVAEAVLLLEVAPLPLTAVEIAQGRRVRERPGERAERDRAAADLAPVAPQRQSDRSQRRQEGGREDRHHRRMRKDRVEALARRRPQRARRPEQRRDPQDERQRDPDAAFVEGAPQPGRPGVPLPALLPHFGERRRQVEGELVRLRVLAGVVAAAAVVAEVGELRDVARGEDLLAGHRGEDGAIALAIAAGVADLDLAARLVDGRWRRRSVKRHGRRPPGPQCVRRRFRWSCRSRRDSPARGSSPP